MRVDCTPDPCTRTHIKTKKMCARRPRIYSVRVEYVLWAKCALCVYKHTERNSSAMYIRMRVRIVVRAYLIFAQFMYLYNLF